jgi:hypothetical protein
LERSRNGCGEGLSMAYSNYCSDIRAIHLAPPAPIYGGE